MRRLNIRSRYLAIVLGVIATFFSGQVFADAGCVVIAFSSVQCNACVTLKPDLVRLRQQGWDIRDADVGRFPALAQKYKIQQLPTLVIVSEGREVDRIVGLVAYEQLKPRLDRAAARSGNGNSRQAANALASARTSSPQPSAQSLEARQVSGPIIRGQSVTAAGARILGQAVTANAMASHSASLASASSPRPISREQAILRASKATVRIRVDEQRQVGPTIERTTAYGTGTIVDVHGDEALVLTCGHLFREMEDGSQLQVELFAGTPQETQVVAQLIDFRADDVDIGLMSFRLPVAIDPVPVLPKEERATRGQPVFTFGCDHGNDPTRFDTRIVKLNRYLGAPNIEIEGAPAVGRSGGGMFDLQGRLIGVCNAANNNDNEGIYAATELVHAQLERLGLSHLLDAQTTQSAPANHSLSGEPSLEMSLQQPEAIAASTQSSGWSQSQAAPSRPSVPAMDGLGATVDVGNNFPASQPGQLICIVPGPDGQSKVVTIQGPSPALLDAIRAQAQD